MKTILMTSIAISVGLITAFAQTNPPTPPAPPSTNVSVHSDESESSSSYSYTMTTDDDDGQSSNVSISTSNSEDSYTFRARHDGSKDDKIKDLLLKEMGKNNLTIKNGKYTWVTNSGGEEVYEIKFSKGRLRINLDKTVASSQLENKIVRLGKSVRTIISGNSEEKRRAAQLQREADRMQRDADRMRREADRLQRDEQRNLDRIKREADRLKRDADRLENNVRRSGGTSAVVQSLLKDSRTVYNGDNKETTWVLPKLLPILSSALLKDGFITSEDDINILKEADKMFVNGKEVSSSKMGQYTRIFRTYDIKKSFDFSFNKLNNHIVVIDDAVAIETILQALEDANLIASTKKKLKLEINGDTVIRNGEVLSTNDVNKINDLLLENNVLSAPGKVLEVKNDSNYQLGYNADGRTFIGTWVLRD